MNTAGQAIRSRRAARGLSAYALSRASRVSINYVRQLETGRAVPRWRTAIKLADALGLAGAERDEFFQIIDAASKPAAILAATRRALTLACHPLTHLEFVGAA